jgi:hypothetical protein
MANPHMNVPGRRIRKLLLGLFAALAAPVVLGQPGEASEDAPAAISVQRPRVGLVLAGGGAKGGAHVGVLKVLDEMHVPIDCIAGTSMGALVGGGYASGIPAADMETFLRGVDWRRVIGGLGRRNLEPIEQKRQGVIYSNNLQLGIQHSRVVLAPGLISTSAIDDMLRGFVGRGPSIRRPKLRQSNGTRPRNSIPPSGSCTDNGDTDLPGSEAHCAGGIALRPRQRDCIGTNVLWRRKLHKRLATAA